MDTWLANKTQSLGIFKINMKSNLTSFTFIIDIPGHTFNDSLVHIIPKNTILSLKSFMKMSELNFTFLPSNFQPFFYNHRSYRDHSKLPVLVYM